jgi:hypothetical protein
MEAAADEWFAAMQAPIRSGIAVAAIAAVKEKPFSFRIHASSLLVFACRGLSWRAATEL